MMWGARNDTVKYVDGVLFLCVIMVEKKVCDMMNERVRWGVRLSGALHALVVVMSLLLIGYASYEILNGVMLESAHRYLQFQLVVCVVFLTSLAVDFYLSARKVRFLVRNMFFILVSIPYINIIYGMGLAVSETAYAYIRFVPLVRSAFALAVVVGYLSKNRITSLFVSYLTVLLASVYFASLIFYSVESPVNDAIEDFGFVIWCSCMNVITLGAPIEPVTVVGRWIYVFLGFLGITIMPLLTVYVGNVIKNLPKRDGKV